VTADSAHGSRLWHAAFRFQYRILALMDPFVRAQWHRSGIGNIVELHVPRRTGSGTRARMVGILRANGHEYLGHPNGEVGWTRDLEAAGGGVIRYWNGTEWQFRASRLPAGVEREQVIKSTGQHPFPGNVVYRLGRRQVRAVGVYFRLSDTDQQ
jgi:hypothetical protein